MGLHRYTFPASEKGRRGLRPGKRRLLGQGHGDASRKGGRPDGDGLASLDGLGKRPAGLLRRGVLETLRKFETIGDNYARASFRTTDGGTSVAESRFIARKRGGRSGKPRGGASGWDFEETAKAADKAWNDELSKVKIETADETARRIFYTALYHTMIARRSSAT